MKDNFLNISEEFKLKNANKETLKMFADCELCGVNENTSKRIGSVLEMFDYNINDLKFLVLALDSILNFRNLSYIDLDNDDMFVKTGGNFDIYTRNFDIVRYAGKHIMYNNVVKFVVSELLEVDDDNNLTLSDKTIGFKIKECSLLVMKEGYNNILSGNIILKMELSKSMLELNRKTVESEDPDPRLCINHINFRDGVDMAIKGVTYKDFGMIGFVDETCSSQFFNDYPRKFDPITVYAEELDGMKIIDVFKSGILNDKEFAMKLISKIK